MDKKILVPTDFSIASWNALLYAIKLYEKSECNFYILNSYSKETHGSGNIALLDPDEAFNTYAEMRSKEGLGHMLTQLLNLESNLKHRFHVISESTLLLNAVQNLNKELKFDMVVMGAKGLHNKESESYGKQTLEIIKNIRKCPILVVPANVSFDYPQEIVLSTNFQNRIKSSEIKYLIEIAKISNANIQILSLAEADKLTFKQKRNKVQIRQHLKGIGHSFNTLKNVKMATALSCFVEIRHANMISYVDKKPSLWERLGFGKFSLNKLGYYSDVPVLALHAK
jgi:nucleotide-binding universal stress UspA family protein